MRIGQDDLSFVDTHVHLDEPAFDPDRAAVLTRSAAAGVGRVVNIGFRPARWASSIRLAETYPGVSIALGLHPQQADEFGETTCVELADLIQRGSARAVGEIGLDYARDFSPPDRQSRAFAAQLDLAVAVGLPVVIHQRAAAENCWDMLRRTPPTLPVVLHCFDGSHRLAHLGLDRGYYFGIGGLFTKAGEFDLRRVVASLPLDRLLLETDAPFLTPSGVKARRNEPANIPCIAARLAEHLGVELDEVARQTTLNAERVFALPSASLATAAADDAGGASEDC